MRVLTPARDLFAADGQWLDHWFVDATGKSCHHRYWLPAGGGYVWVDRSRGLVRPGTLGEQPTDASGSTWRASTIGQVKAMVQACRRQERHAWGL